MRLYDLALSTPWAITPEMLGVILDITTRAVMDMEPPSWAATRETLSMRRDVDLDGTRSVRIRDGVAIVPIHGPIVRRATLFSEISGGTSLDALARDVHIALHDPKVRALLLDIDSPGGEATGINEFADWLYAQRQAGDKPIWAYVEGLGASAAYWIASAAEQIIIDETAALGSIGVVMAVPDPEKRISRSIEFVSSQSPRKRPDPRSSQGKADLQRIVDDTAAVFLAAVARYRGLDDDDLDAVAERTGAGSLAVGKAAVAMGLADGLGGFEATLAELARQVAPIPGGYMGAGRKTEEQPWIDAGDAAVQARRATHETAADAQPQASDETAADAQPQASDETAADKGEGPQIGGGPEAGEPEVPDLPDAPSIAQAREIAQMQAEIQRLLREMKEQASQQWAASLIDRNLATPAIQPQLISLHQLCAAHGALPALEAVLEARPPHVLTEELIGGLNELQPVSLSRLEHDQAAEREAVSAVRRAELLNGSLLGRAARNGKH